VYDTTSTGGTTVADISGATTKQFTFKSDRMAPLLPKPRSVHTTDGTDGNIQYITESGVLNGPGRWHLQAYVKTSAGNWNTTVGDFKVFENLS
jgi:hypothetical protein